MKLKCVLVCCGLVVSACLVVAGQEVARSKSLKTDTDTNALDFSEAVKKLQIAIRTEVEQKQVPAFSISLVDRERVVWADGFGFQDAEKKIPATADTVYPHSKRWKP